MAEGEYAAQLQLHLAPREPIEISELTDALTAIRRQYNLYVERSLKLEKGAQARLLVSSVSPGSIDINLLPQVIQDTAAAVAPVLSQLVVVGQFATKLKSLLDWFSGEDSEDKGGEGEADSGAVSEKITVGDCNDAIAIVKPIAEHGGSQTFNVYNGPVVQQTFSVDAKSARQIQETAVRTRSELQFPEAERHQRVPLIWSRIDRNPARRAGSSPDKAIVEEIDAKPKSVFFADEFSYLKKEMIQETDKPFQTIYFVDVEVSRVAGKVVSYRVVGYHGSDEIEGGAGEPDVPLLSDH